MNKTCHRTSLDFSTVILFSNPIVILFDFNRIPDTFWYPGHVPIITFCRPSNSPNFWLSIHTVAFSPCTMSPFICISVGRRNLKAILHYSNERPQRGTLARIHPPLIDFNTTIFVVKRIVISTRYTIGLNWFSTKQKVLVTNKVASPKPNWVYLLFLTPDLKTSFILLNNINFRGYPRLYYSGEEKWASPLHF